jgi:hypothetical protein
MGAISKTARREARELRGLMKGSGVDWTDKLTIDGKRYVWVGKCADGQGHYMVLNSKFLSQHKRKPVQLRT